MCIIHVHGLSELVSNFLRESLKMLARRRMLEKVERYLPLKIVLVAFQLQQLN